MMTVGKLIEQLKIFADASDAIVRVETEDGLINVTGCWFDNDTNSFNFNIEGD